jgi:para-nitrobenzyl esterase
MKLAALALVALSAFLTGAGAAPDNTEPVVRTDAGQVQGVAAKDTTAFKNIPYAAPPVGDLRWRPPQPAQPWSGVRPGDRYGAICTQRYDKSDNGVGAPPMSEDCLSLNVWTPSLRPPALAPVMVWIHGGGFVNGSGTAALYDGAALARQGVVVVTINYRLGRFGFFAHPALTKEAAGGPVANYGLMDQIAALEWVRRNIAAFGGDPGNVTIVGESAGGISINRLMTAPPAQGLFHKAVAQSGLGSEQPLALDKAEAEGGAFAAKLGVSGDDTAALRALPAETIIGAGDPDIAAGFGPILDGRYVIGRVDTLFAAGRQAKVPYLVGSNALEFPWFSAAQPGPFAPFIKIPAEDLAAVRAAYPGEAAYQLNLISDLLFTEPARFLARAQAATGQPTWLYRFSVLSDPPPGGVTATPHAQERQYVFRTLSTSPWRTTPNDEIQAAAVSAYWVSFAKTGDPNGGGRPAWPRVLEGHDRLLDFTNAGPVTQAPSPPAALDAIERLQAASRNP